MCHLAPECKRKKGGKNPPEATQCVWSVNSSVQFSLTQGHRQRQPSVRVHSHYLSTCSWQFARLIDVDVSISADGTEAIAEVKSASYPCCLVSGSADDELILGVQAAHFLIMTWELHSATSSPAVHQDLAITVQQQKGWKSSFPLASPILHKSERLHTTKSIITTCDCIKPLLFWYVTFHHWSGGSLSEQSDTHPPCDLSRSEMGYAGVFPYPGTVCVLECQRPETERGNLDPAATTAEVWGQGTENTGSDTMTGISNKTQCKAS